MRVDLSLSELNDIRNTIGAEVEILDEELEDQRNKDDLTISRTRMLERHEELTKLLEKVSKAIRKTVLPNRAE
jgi:hypothetical protein